MRIFNIKLKVQSDSKKELSQFMIFVFNDKSIANQLVHLRGLQKSQFHQKMQEAR